MNKERLGDFIGSERKNLGLTQGSGGAAACDGQGRQQVGAGLSYPDVTLLEPLAAALDLTVEELMACRRHEAAKGVGGRPCRALLDISR